MSCTYVELDGSARTVADWRRGGGGVSAFTMAKRYALEHGAAIVLRADGAGVFFTRSKSSEGAGAFFKLSKRTVKDVRPLRIPQRSSNMIGSKRCSGQK